MNPVKIVAFAGSARAESWNKRLVRIAADGAENAGAAVTRLDLKDYPLPVFDQDLESASGLPENARTLKKILGDADGFIISSPEYNSSISPLLKNTIDWCSRPESDEEPSLHVYRGKAAVLMAASPGPLGGIRALPHLRSILQNIGVTILPGMRAAGNAYEAFDAKGNLKDPDLHKAIVTLGADLARFLEKWST